MTQTKAEVLNAFYLDHEELRGTPFDKLEQAALQVFADWLFENYAVVMRGVKQGEGE